MMPAISDIAGASEPAAATVLGAGYVGSQTAVCLAALGHSVVCCEVDASKIESAPHRVATVSEEVLQELLDDCFYFYRTITVRGRFRLSVRGGGQGFPLSSRRST